MSEDAPGRCAHPFFPDLYINIWVLLFTEALLSQTGVSADSNMQQYWILKSKVAAKRSRAEAALKASGVEKPNLDVYI